MTDEYRWLENKYNKEVIHWTQSQHNATLAYIDKCCHPLPELRHEIEAYIDRDIKGPVILVADRTFFLMKKKVDQQYQLYTKLKGRDVSIFNPLKFDPTGNSTILRIVYTESADRAAVALQFKGAEIRTYYIIDTKTGKLLCDSLDGLRGFSWTKDGNHAYITVGTMEMLEKQTPLKTYLYTVGDNCRDDVFLFAPKDAKNYISIFDSKYSDLTFILEGDTCSNSIKIKRIGTFDDPVEIYTSTEYVAYPEAINEKIYFYTNHEAPNFKIMVADKNRPDFKYWRKLYGEKDTYLDGYAVTKDFLIIQKKKDILNNLFVYDLDGKFIRQLELPESGNVSKIFYHQESNSLFASLSTFTAPIKIFRIDASKLDRWSLYYETKVPINVKNIESKIEYYESFDGTKIPIFIIYNKGIKLNGNNPTLLYGYGGFNAGVTPEFIELKASFINRGGVIVEAGIRGGNEYGEIWHKDGMLLKKQNTFDDFIAAAQFLIKKKYTNPQKLGIYGSSNGGLVVGAVLTQRPDLFKAAICKDPLLDMVRFHKFLIARSWIAEYGDPDNREDFQNLLKYSPYHNIRKGLNIPATLVIIHEYDTRVDPLHAKKFVASLQNNPGQISPILLFVNYDSGHGTGKSKMQAIREQEIQWRFIMNQLGIKK